ncbi:MAG: zinc ribbon domain-containing protein [Planctomycetes bacterium]|nr:zinc ribbon domain-containing protein [Planctomycetota bacterium]
MPIREYVCKECGRAFEALVRGAEEPVCPGCGSRELERKLSVFGVGGGGGRAAEPPAPAS